jgi:hypothetical protein
VRWHDAGLSGQYKHQLSPAAAISAQQTTFFYQGCARGAFVENSACIPICVNVFFLIQAMNCPEEKTSNHRMPSQLSASIGVSHHRRCIYDLEDD